jgi:hypothetical protein
MFRSGMREIEPALDRCLDASSGPDIDLPFTEIGRKVEISGTTVAS